MTLEIIALNKTYDNALLLRDISLTIETSEIVCLLGPSGSGKTTLLRIIAGLEQSDSGDIFFDQQNMRNVPVHLRGFGMMFQDLALFPHKNVFDNVAFGLRMQGSSAMPQHEELTERVSEMLELVGLTGFAKRNVNNLSGGEQQRVALARSLAPQPKLLMLDEPLGALDRILREQLVADLRTILKRIGVTALYVTHDQDEAFAIADRIIIMYGGRIAQIGTPAEIYRNPANAFVARFLGMTNLYPARWLSEDRVETELGTFAIASSRPIQNPVALIRPDQIHVTANEGVPARVEECTFRAGKFRIRAVVNSGSSMILESDRPCEPGTPVRLRIDSIEIVPA